MYTFLVHFDLDGCNVQMLQFTPAVQRRRADARASDVSVVRRALGMRRAGCPDRDGLLKSPTIFSTGADQLQEGQRPPWFSAGKAGKMRRGNSSLRNWQGRLGVCRDCDDHYGEVLAWIDGRLSPLSTPY